MDVGQDVEEQTDRQTALHSAMRFQAFAEQTIRQQSLARADVVVKPNIERIPWFDFSNPQAVIDAGYDAAIKTLKASNGRKQTSLAQLPF